MCIGTFKKLFSNRAANVAQRDAEIAQAQARKLAETAQQTASEEGQQENERRQRRLLSQRGLGALLAGGDQGPAPVAVRTLLGA